jgi:hypothetical protein
MRFDIFAVPSMPFYDPAGIKTQSIVLEYRFPLYGGCQLKVKVVAIALSTGSPDGAKPLTRSHSCVWASGIPWSLASVWTWIPYEMAAQDSFSEFSLSRSLCLARLHCR